MLRTLAPFATAGLAVAALTVAVPTTAHAAGTAGPCGAAGTGNPVQHTGNGHHSFTDSHNNCVNFVGTNGTAFLQDSDFNLINLAGDHDTVRDFRNSDSNTITFQAGTSFDTLTAASAVNDVVTFLTGSTGDLIALSGLANGSVAVDGSNDFLVFTAGCGTTAWMVIGNNVGSASAPVTIC